MMANPYDLFGQEIIFLVSEFAEMERHYNSRPNKHLERNLEQREAELVLWHLLYSAYHHRETIVRKAISSIDYKAHPGVFYDVLYEAHSRAYAEIGGHFYKMTKIRVESADDLINKHFRDVISGCEERLMRRLRFNREIRERHGSRLELGEVVGL
jgi:hypothetical protein